MSNRSHLRPAGERGWLAGMKNMMRKENAR